ncbi:MAG: hypothetical protein ACREEM_46310, partial [Blastocatellia bacterium]
VPVFQTLSFHKTMDTPSYAAANATNSGNFFVVIFFRRPAIRGDPLLTPRNTIPNTQLAKPSRRLPDLSVE